MTNHLTKLVVTAVLVPTISHAVPSGTITLQNKTGQTIYYQFAAFDQTNNQCGGINSPYAIGDSNTATIRYGANTPYCNGYNSNPAALISIWWQNADYSISGNGVVYIYTDPYSTNPGCSYNLTATTSGTPGVEVGDGDCSYQDLGPDTNKSHK